MPRLFSNGSGRCIPLVIGDGRSDSGSRLGGTPPAGIAPLNVTSLTKYFATIQISRDPVVEISVFLTFDFNEMADNAGVIHSSGRLVQFVTHAASARNDAPEILSDLSPHPIIHGTECEDWLVDDDGTQIVRAHHKLGGRPYVQYVGDGLPASLSQAEEAGYFQVVQIAFPGAKNGDVDGDWPFADGIFHVLGKEPLDECSWRYFWEY